MLLLRQFTIGQTVQQNSRVSCSSFPLVFPFTGGFEFFPQSLPSLTQSMRLLLHLTALILLGEFVDARRGGRGQKICAGLSAENPIEPNKNCAKACQNELKCGFGYCKFINNRPPPTCFCVECKKKRKGKY
ncbi:unnamed protein product [Cylicocyclus nassatus]|uniref:Uncharacterized protein n=1 Tax=Cylicocyclus nassatus TaxID=53992 RepID=A0AA36HBI9_CYLNA|nr:unnamed protein product [Cylicocyclus nassatus]